MLRLIPQQPLDLAQIELEEIRLRQPRVHELKPIPLGNPGHVFFPPNTSPAASVIPNAAQRSRGISPSDRAPSPTRAPRQKLDTSPAKVDTSPSKLNTFRQKLDTFARKLDTLPPKLNTSARPPEHIPSRTPPASRPPSPGPLPFMVSRAGVFGGPSRTTSRRSRRTCPEPAEGRDPAP